MRRKYLSYFIINVIMPFANQLVLVYKWDFSNFFSLNFNKVIAMMVGLASIVNRLITERYYLIRIAR